MMLDQDMTARQKLDHHRRETIRLRQMRVRDYLREKNAMGILSTNLDDYDMEFIEKIESRMLREKTKQKAERAAIVFQENKEHRQ